MLEKKTKLHMAANDEFLFFKLRINKVSYTTEGKQKSDFLEHLVIRIKATMH
jgi:hypothetical protein